MKLVSHLIIITLEKSLITVLYCCLVLFRHKEVTVYPNDSKKPPEGEGLNRRAEITLDRVWPVDKSTGEYITDPERLAVLRYEERLARAAHRNQAKFIEYRPETGSWVFRVNHFSKYGLDDSDEECELPAAPPKTATLPTAQGQAAQTTTTGAGMFIRFPFRLQFGNLTFTTVCIFQGWDWEDFHRPLLKRPQCR